ncbi:MAG: hypothetical protein JSS10_09180 [Verrucomicrobia bacterium]|nr:hypothetical protein [Verrucomicrobiota bacterium]
MKMSSVIPLLCGTIPVLADQSIPTEHPQVLDSFYPQLKNGDNAWGLVDLLYFSVHERRVVMTNKNTNLFTTADITKKPIIHPHLENNFGYRLGTGYIFSKRKWDVAVNWTHFNTDAHQKRSTHHDISRGMFPLWSLADDILPYDWVEEAEMHWELDLNLVDLDFGYALDWGKLFFLRPYAGLRSAWIDQDFDVSYSGGIFVNGLNLPALESSCGPDKVHMKNNFWGLGPQLGIEPQMTLGKGWRIYGNACGTLEYGVFSLRQKETYLETARYHRHRHPWRFRWIIDAGAGILWKTYCASDRLALTFKLGWEYHIFFDQMELKGDKFDLISDNRNLVLNGAAFSARIDF